MKKLNKVHSKLIDFKKTFFIVLTLYRSAPAKDKQENIKQQNLILLCLQIGLFFCIKIKLRRGGYKKKICT